MSVISVNFVREFQKALKKHGDMYFSMNDYDEDVESIKAVINHQGFWSGAGYRYYFDMVALDKGVVKLMYTERRF